MAGKKKWPKDTTTAWKQKYFSGHKNYQKAKKIKKKMLSEHIDWRNERMLKYLWVVW